MGPRSRNIRLLALACACLALPALWQRVLSSTSLEPDITQPIVFLAIQTAGASVGLLSCALLIEQARRFNQIELGYLAVFCIPLSVLTLVRGLLVPGVFVESNDGFLAAGFWAIPISLAATIPMHLWGGRLRDAIDRRWRQLALISFVVAGAVGAVAFVKPALVPVWESPSTTARVVVGISVLGTWFYSLRHLRLAMLANSVTPLAVVLGFGAIAGSAVMWLGDPTFNTGLWTAQLLIIAGVFLVTLGSLLAYRVTTKFNRYLQPIIEMNPREALTLGLEPLLNRYLETLELGNATKRDHVLGTTELALKIGDRLDFSTRDLRDLGLAALLHDVGQLSLPDELVDQSAPLSAHEIVILEQHTTLGAQMLSQSSALASVAPIVHAHHERIDGSGYPLGLAGSHIPIAARVLSVCDAYDALSRTDEYGKTHSVEPVLGQLEQFTRSRWDRRVVEIVTRYVRANPPTSDPNTLGSWGQLGCDCVPTSPNSINVNAT